PFHRHSSGPNFGEGSRTFMTITAISTVIFSIVFGLTLLFVRAYEQQQQRGSAIAAEQLFLKGKKLYESGDLENAAAQFAEAYHQGKGTQVGENARISLAITYNRLGVRAFEQGNYAAAEEYFHRAIGADPNLEEAQYNLSKLYEMQSRALLNEQLGIDGGSLSGDNATTPGYSPSLQSRYEKARAYFEQGMAAYLQGDIARAREFWRKAVGEAPGTDVAQRAQQHLDETTAMPNF
ncbi:MAG TPA: tetratricopeptide repeat protein, partial [Chthonomonadales bacterium]|nr:tetratricopeptide repeat protein [Chthonomonadales bacterium]